VKIINRYVLKEHVGPFVFALSALTSLILLQYIARKFGDLVGKGLAWQTIAEFFFLSIPFTLAMTLPMAVLVAVLYAFSRLASENEITALKAGGVSTRELLKPALAAGVLLAFFMLWFNDQLLSRANHELATLQVAILRTKPTFALKPQVINPVKEGQLYLRAEQIDQDESGRMRGVTIFDVSDMQRRRSIYADSGTLSFARNKRDLILHLYSGMMMAAPTAKLGQIERIYYREDQLKVRDVANSFQSINADTSSKGEREMTVCEMQDEYERRHLAAERAYADSVLADYRVRKEKGQKVTEPPKFQATKAGGIGAAYCTFITKYLKVQSAEAAEVPQDTSKKKAATAAQPGKPSDSVYVLVGSLLKKVPRNKIPAGAFIPETASKHAAPVPSAAPAGPPPVNIARPSYFPSSQLGVTPTPTPTPTPPPVIVTPAPGTAAADLAASAGASTIAIADAKIRLDDARHWRNRFGVEIQKKFSLAFACIVFVLVGAPIALRFPRGGVGLVMGVGFAVFAIYYVGLIGGEALSDHNIISPFWAMWIANIVFLVIGIALVSRMGYERATSRGGNFAETMDSVRAWFTRRGGSDV
jgi:lipopolysaccharide export system permease protein